MPVDQHVLIVGAGPTGLTLACTLAQLGVKVTIIDKRKTSSMLPRAININPPTLKIFQQLNIQKQFWQHGIRISELVVYWEGRRISNINYKYLNIEFPYFWHLEQSQLEVYLNSLLEHSGNEVRRTVELQQLKQNDEQVNAYMVDDEGRCETKRYDFVVGCDGGKSTVRNLLNIAVTRQSFHAYFVLCDVKLSADLKKNKLHYFLNGDGYLLIVPLPHDKYRVILSFKGQFPGLEQIDLSLRQLDKLIQLRSPIKIKLQEVYWATAAPFYSQIATSAREGRVLLAGDAWHQFSPVGGTNMNTGIADAYALGHKLAAVMNEGHMLSLTEYEFERTKIIKHINAATSYATNLMSRIGENWEQEQKYLPQMKNRHFLKYGLPSLFAGVE